MSCQLQVHRRAAAAQAEAQDRTAFDEDNDDIRLSARRERTERACEHCFVTDQDKYVLT
jgi:hypothetical protein